MYSLSAEGGCNDTVNWKGGKVCVCGGVGGGGGGGGGIGISNVCDYRVPTD